MKKAINYLFLAIVLTAGAFFAASCGKDYGDDISGLSKRISAIEQQNLAEVKSQLGQLSNTLSSLSNTISGISSKNGELDSQIGSLNTAISGLQSTISGLVSSSDFNGFKSAYEAEKSKLTEQLSGINSTLSELSTKVDNAATKEELTSLQSALQEDITSLRNKLDEMGLKLDALQASIRSVVFVPEYSDGKVIIGAAASAVELTYDIQPAAAAKAIVDSIAAGSATAGFIVRTLKTRADGPSATASSVTCKTEGQIVVKAVLEGLEASSSVALSLVLTDAGGLSIQSDYAVVEREAPITVELGGVTYNAAKMADGRVWMIEPLRFVPEGKTVSSNPGDGNGIWYPYTTAGVAETSEEAIKARGYLYDYATAFGVDEVNADNYQSFEGTQGICPDGWYIPTKEDIFGLIGNSPKQVTFGPGKTDAPYYDADYEGGKITALDADGFGWSFSGVVNRTSPTGTGKYLTVKTTTNNCSVEDYLDKVSMSFIMSSTANPSINASNGNIQYAGMMSTFTGSYKEGKLSVAWSNYLSGYSLRCIRKD